MTFEVRSGLSPRGGSIGFPFLPTAYEAAEKVVGEAKSLPQALKRRHIVNT